MAGIPLAINHIFLASGMVYQDSFHCILLQCCTLSLGNWAWCTRNYWHLLKECTISCLNFLFWCSSSGSWCGRKSSLSVWPRVYSDGGRCRRTTDNVRAAAHSNRFFVMIYAHIIVMGKSASTCILFWIWPVLNEQCNGAGLWFTCFILVTSCNEVWPSISYRNVIFYYPICKDLQQTT